MHVHVTRDLHSHIGLLVPFPPLLHQLRQRLQRILSLQQRPVRPLDALRDHLRRHVEVHHQPRLQLAPVLVPHHEAAPRPDDAPHVGVDAVQHLRLDVPKRFLALLLEYLGDGYSRGAFDDRVGVKEVVGAHTSGEGVSDDRLAAPHHADEVEVATLEAGGEEASRVYLEGGIAVTVGGFEEVGILERVLDARIGLVGRRVLPLEAASGEDYY
mmetsp:Transcript_3745/g.7865  ORF Transcript_3745/g.7865 Transcript_3745/m.7865 type:complete len:213 (-) Transcript_3745:237-875(-)